jgi:RimJ/RimL family protein N-acetyltransferase
MLEGRLVQLEPLDAEYDISREYVTWLNDPAVFQFLGSKFPQTQHTIRRYVEQLVPPNFIAKIIERESRQHVGNIAMHQFDPTHRTIELGIIIGAAAARGKGYGREACALAVRYAFDHLDVEKVTAGTVHGNDAMKSVFLSLGFKVEGTLRSQYFLQGARLDVFRFGILRAEFFSGATR